MSSDRYCGHSHCGYVRPTGPTQNWIYQPSNSYYMPGDQNASYYFFPYKVDPETEIVIQGEYPYARYFSFHVTGPFLRFVGSAVGNDLIPDPGSTNPFLPGANWDAKNRNYTLKIRFTAPPEGSNHFVPAAGNNVIYAGTLEDGEPNRYGGAIFFRIYVPSLGYDQTGGVGLPSITYCPAKYDKGHRTHSKFKRHESSDPFFSGFQNTSQQNSHKMNQMSFDDYINLNNFSNIHAKNHNKIDFNQICDLTWRRIESEFLFLRPEPNTVYILSNQVDRDFGHLLFIRWKAPTFPDTYHNFGITGTEDMRYWSITFVTPIGLLGFYTISDYQTIIDTHGYVNLVISFGAQRPSSVTAGNGFTWVDASHLPDVPLFLAYRNNQISQSCPYTAADVPKNEIVTPQDMGKYYPCGRYVTPMYFDCWDKNDFDAYCDDDYDDWDEEDEE